MAGFRLHCTGPGKRYDSGYSTEFNRFHKFLREQVLFATF